jgi:hypothetical protein
MIIMVLVCVACCALYSNRAYSCVIQGHPIMRERIEESYVVLGRFGVRPLIGADLGSNKKRGVLFKSFYDC